MLKQPQKEHGNKSPRSLAVTREGTWIAAGQISSIIAMLVSVRILTEYFKPSDYGTLVLLMTVAGLTNQVTLGALANGMSRFFVVASERLELDSYLNACGRLVIYSFFVASALVLILSLIISSTNYNQLLLLIFAVALTSFFTGVNNCISSIQNAARRRHVVAINLVLEGWMKIGFMLVAIHLMGVSITNVILGYLVSAALLSFINYLLLRTPRKVWKEQKNSTTEKWVAEIWQYSWPFSTWGLFTWGQQISDRWTLELFTSPSDLAYYAIAYQLGFSPSNIALSFIVTLLYPLVYQKAGDSSDQTRRQDARKLILKTLKLGLLLTVVLTIVAATTHQLIFTILVSSDYIQASKYLPWMVMAGGLFANGQILTLQFMVDFRTRPLMKIKIITSSIGIGMIVIGGYVYEIEGVIAGLITFSTFYLSSLSAYLLKNSENNNINSRVKRTTDNP